MLQEREAQVGPLVPAGTEQGERRVDHSMDALQYAIAALALVVAILLALLR